MADSKPTRDCEANCKTGELRNGRTANPGTRVPGPGMRVSVSGPAKKKTALRPNPGSAPLKFDTHVWVIVRAVSS